MKNITQLTFLPLLFLFFFVSPLSAKEETISLPPSSQWNIDYADDSCTLGRKFSSGDKHIAMYITRFEPEDKFELVFIGNLIKKPKSLALLTVQFGEFEDEQVHNYYVSKTKDGSSAIIVTSSLTISAETNVFNQIFAKKKKKNKEEEAVAIKPITAEREKAIKFISFYENKDEIIKLQTGEMKQAFKALRTCTTELVSHWGIDIDRHETKLQSVKPKNDPSKWVTPDDYPRNALLNSEDAIIKFRLKVNDSGKAEECHIQLSIGNESFDQVVCQKVMARARFDPALDKDGNPMTSYYINKVRFHIPN